MKGKTSFTPQEIDEICKLIDLKQQAPPEKQKGIRDKIRALGFYAEDYGLRGIKGGYSKEDFLKAVNGHSDTKLTKWIEQYKKLIKGERHDVTYNELYKWETIQHFQDHWDNDLTKPPYLII